MFPASTFPPAHTHALHLQLEAASQASNARVEEVEAANARLEAQVADAVERLREAEAARDGAVERAQAAEERAQHAEASAQDEGTSQDASSPQGEDAAPTSPRKPADSALKLRLVCLRGCRFQWCVHCDC